MHQEGWRNMEEILLVGCEGGLMVSSRIGSPLFASKVIRICLEMILDNWMVSWRQWKESRTRFLIGRRKCSFAQMFPNPSPPRIPQLRSTLNLPTSKDVWKDCEMEMKWTSYEFLN